MNKSYGLFLKTKVRVVNAPPNKSLDVRAKQRLSFYVAWFLSACVVAVSPHVNSVVGRFLKETKTQVCLFEN